MAGRTLAIGDIHGCDVALEGLLTALAPMSNDTVVVLGDAVDRGPGSRQVIEQLLALRDQCQLVFILGNHEEMMLNALEGGAMREGWLRYGGAATLFSYDGDESRIPDAHRDFLKAGLDSWQTDGELFIHANLEPGVPLEKQSADWLRWTHLSGGEVPHPTGKRVICGHTCQRSGEPLVLPGWICIDTFAHGSGWLTGLDVSSNELVQCNQSGALRKNCLTLPG